QGKFVEAERLYERSQAIREKVLGPEHPGVATVLSNRAGLLYDKGNKNEAKGLYKSSLAIFEKVLSPDHPDVATCLNNLAHVMEDQGNYEEAKPLYERSLAIREKVLGPDHPDVATCLNQLAELLECQVRVDPFQTCCCRISRFGRTTAVRNCSNDDPPATQGNYEGAKPLYERSLGIREKLVGPGHQDVALALAKLAVFFQRQVRVDTLE
ncbi:unnamed protein product, partial [Hapterophycus canaliculatus]